MTDQVAGIDAQVAVAELCAALDLVGRPRAPSISARLGLAPCPPVRSDGLTALTGAGLLRRPQADASAVTPAFAAAAQVLLDPRTELTIRLWTPAHEFETRIQFPGDLADGGGVSLNRIGDRCRIKAYVGPGDALGLAHVGFVETVVGSAAHSFEALFGAPVAILFFAAIDDLRTRAGERPKPAALDPERLGRFLAASVSAPRDPLSLTPYAILASGHQTPLTADGLRRGLEELAAAGLLAADPPGYRPAGTLAELIHPAAVVTAALHWRRVSLLEGGQLGLSNRVVVRLGPSLLLTLDSYDGGDVLVRTTDAAGLADYLQAEILDRSPLLPRRDGDAASPRRATKSVAPKRNRPVPARPFCTGCGKKLQAGNRFCTGCGKVAS